MKYKIADFVLDVYPYLFRTFGWLAADYECESEITDFEFNVQMEDVIEELNHTKAKFKGPNGPLHVNAIQRKFAEAIPQHDAFLFHGTAFEVDKTGIIFSALSGTGKTTHMLLWQKLLGDKMTIVNGDKPIIRFFEDEPKTPYAYGTPWRGKEKFGCNMRTPVKHICFIERSETNYVEKMQPSETIDLIFDQVYMPKDPMAVVNTMQLINRFINCCSIWKIHCNMDIEAAEVAYKTIFEAE